jgi:hypothetical protein
MRNFWKERIYPNERLRTVATREPTKCLADSHKASGARGDIWREALIEY